MISSACKTFATYRGDFREKAKYRIEGFLGCDIFRKKSAGSFTRADAVHTIEWIEND
jgi:hypothetical protein